MDKETLDLLKKHIERQDVHEGAIKTLERDLDAMGKSYVKMRDEFRMRAFAAGNRLDTRPGTRHVFETEHDARGFGLFVLGTVGGDRRAAELYEKDYASYEQRDMSSNPDSAGGALVPVEYAQRIERLVENFGVWPAEAFAMPMNTDSLTFGRRVDGVTVFKVGENTAATKSQPKFANINLKAEEWGTLTLYPRSMAEDAPVIGELVAMEIALAFAEMTDKAGFVGDGTPDYLDVWGICPLLVKINGVDDGGGLVLGTGAAGAKWGSLAEGDFMKVKSRAPSYAQGNGKWYASHEFFWSVMVPITLSKGGVTASEFAGKRELLFLGDPVRITQAMPRVAADSQVCALYGDLRLSSTHGRRRNLLIEQSTEVKFIERQVAVLGTQRHAIANHSLGDADNAGPVVGLITPAAAG